MPWNNPEDIMVPGDGQAYVAPVGSTLPAPGSDPTASLDPALKGLGFWTEDGLTLTQTPTIKDFGAFQSKTAVRRSLTALDVAAAFVMQQWDENTVVTAFGGSVQETGGITTFTPLQARDALPELALVIDLSDGDKNWRFVYPRTNTVTEAVSVQYKKDEVALLPVTAKALTPLDGSDEWYWMTDADGFAAGS